MKESKVKKLLNVFFIVLSMILYVCMCFAGIAWLLCEGFSGNYIAFVGAGFMALSIVVAFLPLANKGAFFLMSVMVGVAIATHCYIGNVAG